MKQVLLVVVLLSTQLLFSQDQRYDICPLKVGQEIPNTSLIDNTNESISLSTLVNNKPTVLVFYRGAWCGYCTKHLSELNDSKADIEKLGYQIVGITIDKAEKLAESLEKASAEIEVFSDATAETIKAFGLDWKVDDTLFNKYKNEYKLDLEEWSGQDHHSLPVPAIFVINENKIEFQYVNPDHSIRLKAETLLAILETL